MQLVSPAIRYIYIKYTLTFDIEDPGFNAFYYRISDVNLLDEWFLKDDNANPPVYTQRSLTSKFDNYNST